MNSDKRILIVEDDETLRDGLVDAFLFHEYLVYSAGDGQMGLDIWREHKPDLIVLDVMLPGRDGFEICRKIRQSGDNVPILILTAKDQEADKLLGFEHGADDYMTKPFSIKELVARVGALLRRSATRLTAISDDELSVGPVIVHFRRFCLIRDGREYPLSPKECDILRLLASCPGVMLDRMTIIDQIWGDDYDPTPRTIDNFIRKLRKKIEVNPAEPKHLITVHGAGYKLCY